MKYCAIIYARYNSSRLPGKVLIKIGNKTVLQFCVEKLLNIKNLKVVVATSNQVTDDPIAKWCVDNNTTCFRGNLDDVALRTENCLNEHPCDAFFRINADSPYLQPNLIESAINIFESATLDLVTNIQERSFPYGISVELISSALFLKEVRNFNKEEREHITSYFYKNSDKFKIKNIKNSKDLSSYRFVLDTKEDLMELQSLYHKDDKILHYNLLNLIKIKN